LWEFQPWRSKFEELTTLICDEKDFQTEVGCAKLDWVGSRPLSRWKAEMMVAESNLHMWDDAWKRVVKG